MFAVYAENIFGHDIWKHSLLFTIYIHMSTDYIFSNGILSKAEVILFVTELKKKN